MEVTTDFRFRKIKIYIVSMFGYHRVPMIWFELGISCVKMNILLTLKLLFSIYRIHVLTNQYLKHVR